MGISIVSFEYPTHCTFRKIGQTSPVITIEARDLGPSKPMEAMWF